MINKDVSKVINNNLSKISKIFADEFNCDSTNLIIDGYNRYSNEIFDKPGERKSNQIPFNKFNCVYFLMNGDCVSYVGQTSHLCARVAAHVGKGKKFEYVSWFIVDREDMMLIEAFNIKHYNPELNIEIPGLKELIYLVAKKVS